MSPKKRRFEVVVTGRGKRHVHPADAKKDAEALAGAERERLMYEHRTKHPNDKAFARKHGLLAGQHVDE